MKQIKDKYYPVALVAFFLFLMTAESIVELIIKGLS